MTFPKPTPRDGQSVPQSGVIPIRGKANPGPTLTPTRDSGETPRPRSTPVADRPYRILVVPPTPGARTRAFDIARWQAAMVVMMIALAVFVTGAVVSTIVASLRGPDMFASGELTALRDQLVAVEDSLSVTRAALADAESSADSAVVAARASRRPRPLLSRVRRGTGAREGLVPPGGVEGLPVLGAIVSGFSYARRHPLLQIIRPHLGVDVSAPRGTRITAPAAGRVSYVGRKFAFGLVVEIEHAGGILTRYAHLRTAVVKVGDKVERGGSIATVGSSGLTTGPHLHYEILDNGRAVDPLRFKLPQPVDSAAVPPAPAPIPQDSVASAAAAAAP